MRVKIQFLGSSLSGLTSGTGRSITVSLFANYDAYANSYQSIVSGSVTQFENCYYPDVTGSCYINHANGGGNFILQ
jgi:hypothetical protein